MSEVASRAQLRMSLLRWALVCVPAILLLGFLSGSGTRASIAGWYNGLAKPAATPPDWAFPVVWPVLYVLLGLALAIVLNARGARGRGAAVAAFVVTALLNFAWTPLFFGAHRVGLALVDIAAMIGAGVVTAVLFGRIRQVAGWLLVPFLVWISYAAVLNWRIDQLNPNAGTVAPGAVSTQIIR